MSDTHHEVLIVIIAGAIIFFVLTSIMTFITIYYQKKKFQHHQQLLQKEREYHQQILQSQLEMQEQTFNIISQEIHDNVGQSLSLAKVQLNILESGERLDKSLIADTKDSVSKALTDLRDIAKSLQSERIQQSRLPEVISQELERINRSGHLRTHIEVEGKEYNVQEQKKLIVFRIVQEALQNILKHANARNIFVRCEYCEDKLWISIVDDGKGFDDSLISKKDGLGLLNMMNRAALVGGEAHIKSKSNEGTTITIITPYV